MKYLVNIENKFSNHLARYKGIGNSLMVSIKDTKTGVVKRHRGRTIKNTGVIGFTRYGGYTFCAVLDDIDLLINDQLSLERCNNMGVIGRHDIQQVHDIYCVIDNFMVDGSDGASTLIDYIRLTIQRPGFTVADDGTFSVFFRMGNLDVVEYIFKADDVVAFRRLITKLVVLHSEGKSQNVYKENIR